MVIKTPDLSICVSDLGVQLLDSIALASFSASAISYESRNISPNSQSKKKIKTLLVNLECFFFHKFKIMFNKKKIMDVVAAGEQMAIQLHQLDF